MPVSIEHPENQPRSADETDEKALLLDLAAIRLRCAELEILHDRGLDDIIGYDEYGLPA
jgi:hypothetical protein